MTLTKADIVSNLTNHLGFSKKQTTDTVKTLLEIIKSTLVSGDDVLISGFGKFCVREKAERRGRNPATGGDMMLRSRKVVTFKCSGKLRDKINKGGNMSEERLKEFRQLKERIGEQKKRVGDVIVIKQGNIAQDSKTIAELKKCEANYFYLDIMMNDVSEDKIVQMSDGDFAFFTNPIRSPAISGEVIVDVYEQSKSGSVQYGQHYSVCASLDSVMQSGTSGYMALANARPEWFPNKDQITREYKVEDNLFKEIDYIRGYLNGYLPDVAGDFDAFIDKYNAFQSDSSQYQDLIGSRSMFFFKMIFEFSKQIFGVEFPRANAIRKFVFGNAAPVSIAEPIIQDCKDLYIELSNQNDPSQSVKLGNVTPEYVDSIFRRIIGDIAALLKLRENNYRT